jgi:hypothetical protein
MRTIYSTSSDKSSNRTLSIGFTSPDNLAHKVLRDVTELAFDLGWWSQRIEPPKEVRADVIHNESAIELVLDAWGSPPYRISASNITDDVRVDLAAGLMAGNSFG